VDPWARHTFDARARREPPPEVLPDLWHKNAIVYSVDVDTFMDSDGDGCGDFEGIGRRLDYLDSLGVNTLWLGPFQPTPGRDNGYDVSDYYGVDPRLGTLGDFVEFSHEAKSRGIRVIVDLVANHTSDRHPWFRAARRDPESPFHDWYVWSKKRPPDWKTGMVFPGVQERTWTYAREVGKYYFHRFFEFEPDLNMENPQVREEMRRVMGFWLELGVAGFRVDAVPFILEKPSRGGRRHPLRFEYLREMRDFLQWRVGNAVLLGEANVLPQESARYFHGGDGLHLMFNFWVNQHLFYALASGDARPLAQALRATHRLPEGVQWAQFLRNHDELDLGRLSEEQRRAVFERFGPEPSMQLYDRGIRRRLAPMLGDRRRLELAYSVMFSLPGIPVLYYGDEIGMGDNLSLRERASVRTPMQWSDEPNGGFSRAQTLVVPAIEGGVYGCESVNVEQQQRDSNSFLRWMRHMIHLRKECPEIGWGEWNLVSTRTPSVLALVHRWRGRAVLCVHNFDDHPREFTLGLECGSERLVSLRDEHDAIAMRNGRPRLQLEPHGYAWYRLGRGEAASRSRTPED
jgi:maltose alpha-D-glucosyltransferase/alpha-amylase